MKISNVFGASILSVLAFCQPSFALDYEKAIAPNTQKSMDVATGFYEDTLIYRNLDNIERYIGAKYIQHAPFYGDGTDQLLKALENELNENPAVDIRIHRTIAEDNYVAIHSTWDYGTDIYVYVDIWRVEDGKLVEHWDHSQVAPKEAVSSNTLYLGPDVNVYIEQDTTRNTERALAVIASFDNLSDLSAAEDFLTEEYIQHNPEIADGKQAFIELLKDLDGENIKLKTSVSKTITMGDMVLVHSMQVDLNNENDRGTGFIDIFRFEKNGLIAEHWDIAEAIPEKSKNNNGIFTYPAQ